MVAPDRLSDRRQYQKSHRLFVREREKQRKASTALSSDRAREMLTTRFKDATVEEMDKLFTDMHS